mmetsp:Transcript_43091/g.113342  ORF Transcript_43091/g.113342 Transcript_43091/m.113342 type:complete len:727 (+) Transcript_43091:116-2296(+)
MRVSCFVAAAAASQVNPVQKVISLLGKLQSQLEDEGKAEAASYDKYACFCKETSDEKQYAITKSKKVIDDLTASIEAADAHIETLQLQITEKEGALTDVKSEMETEQGIRDEAKEAYDTESADLTEGIRRLKEAIKAIKESNKKMKNAADVSSALQMLSTSMWYVADQLTQEETELLQSFMQAPAGKAASYHRKNSAVIELLQKLLQVFKGKLKACDDEESTDSHGFNQAQMKRTHLKQSLQKSIESAQTTIGELTEKRTKDDDSKTKESEQLALDQDYLRQLGEQCEGKAADWDSRSQARAEELTALATAMELLATKVTENYSANSKLTLAATGKQTREVQSFEAEVKPVLARANKRMALMAPAPAKAPKTVATSHDVALETAEARAIKEAESFVQIGAAPSQEPAEVRALRFIVSKAKLLHSPSLAAIATMVGKDPFKKVRDLINDLITKLEDQAADEETEKDFCVEEMGKETENRDNAKMDEEKAKSSIAASEAKIAGYKEEIAAAEESVAALNKEAEEALALREEEKENNENTIASATEGEAAVKAAIAVLTKFYASSGEFIQEEPKKDEQPVEGSPGVFKASDTSHQGNQILDFLAVIEADFGRTITTVTKAEEDAQSDYDAAKKERDGQIEAQEKIVEDTGKLKDTEETTLFDTEDQLKDAQKSVEAAVEALEKLKPQCVDQGLSYKERTARREQEIEALKEALGILTESTADFGFMQKQ